MARVMLTLTDEERAALIDLALQEKRYPRDQAALLVRHGLERAGLLPKPTPPGASLAPANVTKASALR